MTNMKGYKTVNGGYITGKELEQAKRKYKKEMQEYRKQKEQEEKKKEQLYIAQYMEEKRQIEQAKKDKEIFITECRKFLEYMAKNYNYKLYILAYDICSHDYFRIKNDLYNKKITIDDLKNIYNIARNMITKLDFYIDTITEYYYKELTE